MNQYVRINTEINLEYEYELETKINQEQNCVTSPQSPHHSEDYIDVTDSEEFINPSDCASDNEIDADGSTKYTDIEDELEQNRPTTPPNGETNIVPSEDIYEIEVHFDEQKQKWIERPETISELIYNKESQ